MKRAKSGQTKRQIIEAILADMKVKEPWMVERASIYLEGYTKKQLESELASRTNNK